MNVDDDGGSECTSITANTLLALPDAALIEVLAHLRNPLPLAHTCKTLLQLSTESRALHSLWLHRFGAGEQPWRPAVARLLTFRPLRGAPARELVALLLQHLEASEGQGQAQAEALDAARAAQRAGQVSLLGLLCMVCMDAFVQSLMRDHRAAPQP